MKLNKIIFLLAVLFSANPVYAQTKAEKIDSIVTALYAKGKFNGNVLVAEKGNVLFQKSYGNANEEKGEKLDANSVFELASVSKQFTAMGIMMLKEKGKLNLEDTIGKYIPELKFYGHVTIRNLLNHTGGLPDYMELVMEDMQPQKKIAVNDDIIRLFAKNKPAAVFSPGEKYEYSNTGYALLASVIMKISGESFDDFLQKNIFTPLQMTNSFVYSRRLSPRNVKDYAFGYVYSKKDKKYILPDGDENSEIVIWLDGIVGDGTVNSTTGDLLKWDRALYTGKLISKEGVNELFSKGILNNGRKIGYGMGWMIDSSKAHGKAVWHSGGWPGYRTYIDREIANDYTIIFLQNHDETEIPFTEVKKVLYNEDNIKRTEITLTNEQIKPLEGEYELGPGVTMKIFTEDGLLKTQLTGQKAFPIFAESETKFFLKVVDAQLEFVKDDKGKVEKVILHQNSRDLEAKKIE